MHRTPRKDPQNRRFEPISEKPGQQSPTKNRHDAEVQQVPRRIQKQAIANEYHRPGYEPTDLFGSGRMIKTRLKTSVSLNLKIGGDSEDEESSGWSRDELAELIH